MKDTTNGITLNGLRYESPQVKEIPVNTQSVLCQSGNERMLEKDYGSGGFK